MQNYIRIWRTYQSVEKYQTLNVPKIRIFTIYIFVLKRLFKLPERLSEFREVRCLRCNPVPRSTPALPMLSPPLAWRCTSSPLASSGEAGGRHDPQSFRSREVRAEQRGTHYRCWTVVNSGGKCLSTFAARSRNSAVHPRVSVSILDRVWRWSGCSFNLRPRIARNVAISFLCFLLIFYTKSHPPLGVVPGKQHHLSHGGHAARQVVHPGDGEHGRYGCYSSPGI